MHATTITSPLADQLRDTLTGLRFTETAADDITTSIPPAGQHWLLNRIERTPHPLRTLQQLVNSVHRDTLAAWLRCPTADAETVIARIREATR